MTSIERFDFHNPDEPGEEPLYDTLFDILSQALQPDAELSLGSAVEQLSATIPSEQDHSSGMGTFLPTCYELAAQIPYNHASLVKVITIMDMVIASNAAVQGRSDNRSFKYQTLSETLRDWWNSSDPSESPQHYISFQTFAAHVLSRGMGRGTHLAQWTLQMAFEDRKKESMTPLYLEAYVMAASQWIVIYGEEIYRDAVAGGQGWFFKKSSTDLTLKHWRRWKKDFRGVAGGKSRGGIDSGEECKRLAASAAEAMDELELKKGQ
ncbi:uncharacterized protein LTR77_011167 [Saxophila tyrrhenica]|uniref:Uncharacterized protein n=1 Tax=Saxophila tyrrhenica TaxID=1690608 RepID=A0AAV9NTB6_9PEZI|nr:hypothetical protein LTR77_011167 [Saxophila tyrrhenica]